MSDLQTGPPSLNCVGIRREESNPPLKRISGRWYYHAKQFRGVVYPVVALALLVVQIIILAYYLGYQDAAHVATMTAHNGGTAALGAALRTALAIPTAFETFTPWVIAAYVYVSALYYLEHIGVVHRA